MYSLMQRDASCIRPIVEADGVPGLVSTLDATKEVSDDAARALELIQEHSGELRRSVEAAVREAYPPKRVTDKKKEIKNEECKAVLLLLTGKKGAGNKSQLKERVLSALGKSGQHQPDSDDDDAESESDDDKDDEDDEDDEESEESEEVRST